MHQFFDLHLKLFLDVKKCIENPCTFFFYKKTFDLAYNNKIWIWILVWKNFLAMILSYSNLLASYFIFSIALVDIIAHLFMVVNCCVMVNNHNWKRWSQTEHVFCKRGWWGSLLGKKCSWTNNKRHIVSHVKKSARHRLAILSLFVLLWLVRWESPPSNWLRATRKPDVLVLSEIHG